jgi:NAD(P)-dependent dehydrogenase (short-subunit alcohol dehydrogenase family)
VAIPQPVLEVTEQAWDQMFDTNVKGVFFCCQAIGRGMVERRYGKIINLASVHAVVGWAARSGYATSKAAVAHLTRLVAIEFGPYGVCVNALSPTMTETPATAAALQDPSFRSQWVKAIPMSRLGSPSDLLGAAIFLASPASDFVNGHQLLVDGGQAAR